jgi:Tol biopolymer transport system component
LPTGLSLNEATGDVTGTPAAAGNFTVVFAGKDSMGNIETCPVSFVVHPRTDRVSIDTNGNSVAGSTNREPSISSTDGRFIAFTSSGSALIPGVVGQQIYLHDRQTGQPSLVSKDNSGSAGIGGVSSAPSVSADGRFVAFVSTATNLVPGVTGQQIYLHDTQTSPSFPNGRTTLVSKDSSGIPASAGPLIILSNTSPTISANGRFITFVSNATNLVPGVSGQQIYLHDTQPVPNGQTTLVSKDGSGIPANVGSSNITPRISANGLFVAFVSTATNLVPGVSGQQIYLHDTQPVPNGQTSLVSKDGSGSPATAGLSILSNTSPTISADGRFVAFASNATNLVGNFGLQIYLHDTQTSVTFPNGQTTLVSKDGLGNPATAVPLNISNTLPTISTDGRFVAFLSTATNLVPGVSGLQIYLHDTQLLPNGQTTLVSKDESGTPATAVSSIFRPVVATNGAFVAFVSPALTLVTFPPPAAILDVYVRAHP